MTDNPAPAQPPIPPKSEYLAVQASPEFAEFPDIIDNGVGMLDRAVELEPDNAEARFWREIGRAHV